MGGSDEGIMLDGEFLSDPHAFFRKLRAEAPACRLAAPNGFKGWLVTRYADARELLADSRISKDTARARKLLRAQAEPGDDGGFVDTALSQHMLNADPPVHTRLRKLVNKAFTARTVARLRPRIEEITAELLDEMAKAGSVDLVKSFAFPLPTTVICELLGVPGEDRERFSAWSATLLSRSELEAVRRDSAAMATYLRELIDGKRQTPTEDLLSELVHVSEEGDRLSAEELVAMAFLLLVAGHETTVNLIGSSVLALLDNPDQLAALRADESLLPNAIEEFLRFEGPVNIATLRFTVEPVRVGEVEIPAGEFVLISLLSANRDPGRFPDPDRLDVTRAPGGHLAFGHGIHYCVGAPLARLEAEIALGGLLRRFDSLALEGEPETLRWRDSTLIRGLESLPIRVH
ncbi:cytochrome P450 family protein [Amycolatopsis taiwanensis]|uniref:cytochrome P450 family protein n=1 Tax=Amycolatopsis taiwanensis TaxID=342230 RepID=UPI00047FF91E|nr:cytochrome P450 [Amycolatopsis taiwanensis]